MIFLSQERVAQMILLSFVYGLVFGAIADVVRLLRSVLIPAGHGVMRKIRRVVVVVFNFTTDLFFVLGFASCAVIFTYNMSGGVFRGIVYVMMAAGITVYSILLRRWTARSNAWLSKKIKLVLWKIIRIISVPIAKIKKLINRLYALTIGKKIDKIKKEKEEGKGDAYEA